MKTTKERRKEKRLKIEENIEYLQLQLENKVKKLEEENVLLKQKLEECIEENNFLRIELEKYKAQSESMLLDDSIRVSVIKSEMPVRQDLKDFKNIVKLKTTSQTIIPKVEKSHKKVMSIINNNLKKQEENPEQD